MNDEWQLRWVRVPEGTHLSNSRQTRGANRDLLREDGTNRNLGPTESLRADESFLDGGPSYAPNSPDGPHEPGLTRGQEFVIGLVTEVINAIDWDAVVEQVVAPAVKRRMAKIRNRVRSAVGRSDDRDPNGAEVVRLDPPAVSTAVVASPEPVVVSMSGAEFRERTISALAAEAYAARQKEILSNARIIDQELPEELASAMQLVLEGKLSSLEDRQMEALMEFFNDSDGAERVPALLSGEQDEGVPQPPTPSED